jgi:hypothetical protein
MLGEDIGEPQCSLAGERHNAPRWQRDFSEVLTFDTEQGNIRPTLSAPLAKCDMFLPPAQLVGLKFLLLDVCAMSFFLIPRNG